MFKPPDDLKFQGLLEGAVAGEVPVYGVVLETAKIKLHRFDDTFRPENSTEGEAVIRGLFESWNSGDAVQPWLYVEDGTYIVADDYFAIAAIERGRPDSFAAQVLGEPLPDGLKQKVGPLDAQKVKGMLGIES